MFTIQEDLAKILTEGGWQGEVQGFRLKIPLPLYVSFMSSFYLTTLRSYLELADEYDAEIFVDSATWFELGKLDRFLASCGALTGNGVIYHFVTMLVSVCFGLFAFTCLLGFLSFTEMCANRISTRPAFINMIRVRRRCRHGDRSLSSLI